MTTKVIVDAHAGWPVLVEALDTYPAGSDPVKTTLGIVEPGSVRDFYVTNTRQILVTEQVKET